MACTIKRDPWAPLWALWVRPSIPDAAPIYAGSAATEAGARAYAARLGYRVIEQ